MPNHHTPTLLVKSLFLLSAVLILLLSPHKGAAQDCGDYSGCDMIQLKVSGVITNAIGIPIPNATVTGVTTLVNNINAIEYYEHCGDRNHTPRIELNSISSSGSTIETIGFYEIMFIICTDNPDDCDLDFLITIEAPGFRSLTLPGDFSEGDYDDEIDVTLITEKENALQTPSVQMMQSKTLDCGDYTGCDMAVLKARGYIVDEQLLPIINAQVVAVETNRDNVNVVQFYNACGGGFYELSVEEVSTSDSNSFAGEPGFFELVFAVCHDDSKGWGVEWDADFELTVSAPGFQSQTFTATFDEDDDRDDIDFVLSPSVAPTHTPTQAMNTPTPTATHTQPPPTNTPTNTPTQQPATATPTPVPPTLTATPTRPTGAVCIDYGGCQPIILKVLGMIEDSAGNPLSDATVSGVESLRSNVRVIEFFSHCGNGLHSSEPGKTSFSDSVSSQIPGFYELQFIVCVDNPSVFTADFQVCVNAPGYGTRCIVATFDNNNSIEVSDIVLQPQSKTQEEIFPASGEIQIDKGSETANCESYLNCNMALLKTRGFISDTEGNPIYNASISGAIATKNNVRGIQFYQHCTDGAHFVIDSNTSRSASFGTAGTSFYELQFTACIIDRNPISSDPFDADFEVCVTAPGYVTQCVKSRFDENISRHRLDIILTAGSAPTETPTAMPSPTPESPTETPSTTPVGTALNPNADIDGNGRIDHLDLLEILRNWYHIVE